MPDDRRRERRRILKDLQDQPVEVKVLPAVEDIASGRVSVTDLRPVEVNDLLGRDKVPPNADLLARKSRGKSILITGAGGSIGSELVRQLLKQAPRPHRAAGYLGSRALPDRGRDHRSDQHAAPQFPRPELVGVLGSVLDAAQLRETIVGHGVQVIYHAAAYKHVPIVEQNAVCGLRNNTFGTLDAGRMRAGRRRRARGAHFHRQGRPSHQCHGRQQASRRAGAAGRGRQRRPDALHHGSLR